MTEQEWLSCTDRDVMLNFLRDKASDRKLRLFACACCHRIGHLLIDNRSRRIVEATERFADGEIDFDTLCAALDGPNRPKSVTADLCFREAWWAAFLVSYDAAAKMCAASQDTDGALYISESQAQCLLLREVMGNPFRDAFIHTKRLMANKGRTRTLAHAIYDNRDFATMPILADALQEAGCDNADILNHCRLPGEHVRGCWVVDLLLGKS